jgi:hypothetical protein
MIATVEDGHLIFPEGSLPDTWKMGDIVEWIDNQDGSWTLRKKEMTSKFVEKVVEFNAVAGTGGEFDARKTALYIGLVLEELHEVITSIEDQAGLGNLRVALDYHARLFKSGNYDENVKTINRVEALDGFVDVAVVAVGGGVALGADVVGACEEVADNNLSKFPVGASGERYAMKDINGKVVKPAGYKPPNLERFLM